MIDIGLGVDEGIVGVNRGARAEGGLKRGPKRRRPRRPRRLRCRPRHRRRAPAEGRPRPRRREFPKQRRCSRRAPNRPPGAQHVHLRDGQVVACDHQVEIVFKRQVDGVVQRQVELAVAYERIEARENSPGWAAARSCRGRHRMDCATGAATCSLNGTLHGWGLRRRGSRLSRLDRSRCATEAPLQVPG